MAVLDSGTIQSPGSLKGFNIVAGSEANAHAIAEALNPVM